MNESEAQALQEEVRRAGRAQEVLENATFKDAVSQVEQALLHGMKNTAIADEKLRLRLLDRYELLHSLVDVLRSTMETGQFAKQQLEEMEKKSVYERALKAVGWN